MPDFHENDLLPGAGGGVKQLDEVDDSECFEPTLPESSEHKPAKPPGQPASKEHYVDAALRNSGIIRSPADPIPERELRLRRQTMQKWRSPASLSLAR